MKRKAAIAAVAAAVLSLSGCMNGPVGVNPDTQTAGSGSPSASSPPELGHQTAGSSSNVDLSEFHTVFFEWTNLLDTGRVVGLGFLSELAKVDQPFEFVFQPQPSAVAPHVVTWQPVVLNATEEVAWIAHSASEKSELEVLDPSTLRTQDLGTLTQGQSYALQSSPTGGLPQVAEIDSTGQLLASSPSGNRASGATGFSSQARVHWIDAGSLGVVDPSLAEISFFSALNLTRPLRILKGSAFAASPDGKSALIFSAGSSNRPGTLKMLDLASGREIQLDLSPTTFDQARWDAKGRVAFVDQAGSGAQLDVLTVATGKLIAQYPVSSPAGGEDSICPAWVGGKLFFSSQDASGASVIWEADGVTSQATEFAVSEDSSQGFQCPKGVSQ